MRDQVSQVRERFDWPRAVVVLLVVGVLHVGLTVADACRAFVVRVKGARR